ncbi:MAG: fimbrial protein [Betaproteobacteria bacterium]|nr:MAG: fimbrial protein [Betaproteobacteria bacterium]
MIRINLLPHRAAKRALRKREFNMLLLGTVVAAATIWYVGKLILDERIATQQRRNDMLIAENKKLDARIEEIKKLQEQTSALLARKQVVETLQVNRAASVKLLDQLVRQLPDGVYLKAIKQTGNKINLVGLAQSNARVSSLMRNLESSPYLQSAELVEIKAVTERNQRLNEFSLNISLKGLEDPNAVKTTQPASAAAAVAPSSREKVMQAITK